MGVGKRRCYTCGGRGYFYSQPYDLKDGKLRPIGKKKKAICPNCTANVSDYLTKWTGRRSERMNEPTDDTCKHFRMGMKNDWCEYYNPGNEDEDAFYSCGDEKKKCRVYEKKEE